MDENLKKKEYEMLEALYDYTGNVAQTLNFKKDEQFIFHPNNNIKRNWWYVISSNGKVGYIPSNYVSVLKVRRSKILDFLTSCIEKLSSDIAKERSDKQLEIMKELIEKKQEIESQRSKEKLTCSKSLPESKEVEKEVAPTIRVSNSEIKFPQPINQERFSSEPTGNIPHKLYNLIQQVRGQTGLSFDESRIAIGVVSEGFLELLPSSAIPSVESILELLNVDLTPPIAILDDTSDARNLRQILSHLTSAKEDSQQRSWHLWDDEATIKQNITQLSSILSNADPAISKRVLKSNSFSDINTLVDYYQMEDRYSIRQLLLQTFAILCSLDKIVIAILLNSVLPTELAREMLNNLSTKAKLGKPAMLLSMIFSTGEAMPITHLDHIGVEFIKIILDVVETDETDPDISDKMLTLILSYNLQFKPKSSSNIIIQALNEVSCPKTFTEKVLLLINREDDPIANLKIQETPCNSVLKLLKDLFSHTSTANMFYTNDVKVLVDIVVRQILDLPPNSPKRTDYLELCKLVMYNCDSLAFEHRLNDLKSVFSHITEDELPAVDQDKLIVNEIIEALPQHFSKC